MDGNLESTASVSTFRRYSDSCFLDATDDCSPIPSVMHDFVSTNNHKNDKLNELSHVDCKNNNVDGCGGDEIEDDWFHKLTNSKDFAGVPSTDGSASDYGLNYTEVPLLCDDDLDLKEKTMRSLRVGLKKIWRRGSATITAEDPTYKVAYLGNVVTGWAKGEGCIDKPLGTIWKNYNSPTKRDVQMKITVTQSGLKAVTKDHGLIEYWSHRITYCTVPASLPRIFCWIYRHEGRKLKQELRCHAVLCPKESIATRMAVTLKLRLTQALLEFKRNKLLRQNARLSLANSVYDNPSLPRRKILLSIGSHNYKPPLERSKSAPKLMSIEESLEEEENTPKAKRKFSIDDILEEENLGKEKEEEEEEGGGGGGGEGEDKGGEGREEKELQLKKSNCDQKYEYKFTHLNFVKKLCSSIENLVESTSNYSKKFLTERKSSKNVYLVMKKSDESPSQRNNKEEENKHSKPLKNFAFAMNNFQDSKLVPSTDLPKKVFEEDGKNQRMNLEITVELKDQECEESSNSLPSLSSCCSDVSSLTTNFSDKSSEEDMLLDSKEYETSIQRLHKYLNSLDDPILENINKVIIHPAGEEAEEMRTNIVEEESICDEVFTKEEDTISDESGYVESTGNLVKRLNLDSKEKDIPYHKIIKSTVLRPTQIQASCLQI